MSTNPEGDGAKQAGVSSQTDECRSNNPAEMVQGKPTGQVFAKPSRRLLRLTSWRLLISILLSSLIAFAGKNWPNQPIWKSTSSVRERLLTMRITRDEPTVVVINGEDFGPLSIRQFRLHDGALLKDLRSEPIKKYSRVFFTDNGAIFCDDSCLDNSVKEVDFSTGKIIQRNYQKLPIHKCSSKGKYVVTKNSEASFVFERETGVRLCQLPACSQLMFSPDEQWVVGWQNDQQFIIYRTVTGEKIAEFEILKGRWKPLCNAQLDRDIFFLQVGFHMNGTYEFCPSDTPQVNKGYLKKFPDSLFVEVDEQRTAIDHPITPRNYYRPLIDGTWFRLAEPGGALWRKSLHERITRLGWKYLAEYLISQQDRIVTIDRISNRWSPALLARVQVYDGRFDVSQDGEFAVTVDDDGAILAYRLRSYAPIWIKQILLGFVSFGVLYMLLSLLKLATKRRRLSDSSGLAKPADDA